MENQNDARLLALWTSTCVWRGRRGTCWLGRRWSPLVARGAVPLCMAGVALGDIYFHVAGVVLGESWRHLPAFGVAGVALGDIYLRLAWQAWHLLRLVSRLVAVGRRWSPRAPRHFAWQAWHLVTFTFVLRGRCGTWRHLPAFGVAIVVLVRFTSQSWHLETSTFGSRGRRGTWRHLLAFGVAGMALGDIYLRLVCQV